jgi:tetratricopeptide (TPR) repeat protein
MSPAHAPARAAAAFLAVAAILAPVPARAMTAADARHDSFKLQAEGLRLYREGKYPEAVEVLQKVVNIHLNSFMAWYYLGAALEAERRYSDAVDPLKTALDLQPDHLPAHLALGDCYLKLGDAGEARAAYLRALDQQANYAPAHDGLGRLAESIGKDDEAEDEYRKALEINPAFADAYTHLGELYLRRAKLQEATDLFLKAIAMKPDFSQAYVRLGVALSRQGRYDDAIAAARKSQVLAPRDPEPLLALARIDLEMQNLKRARKNVDQAIAIDPEHVYAHIMEAELARADGSLQLAQMILEKRLERPIDEPRWKRDLQNRLKQTRADVKILEGLQATAAANPTDPMATVALARFWAVQRDHRRAAELFLAAAGQSEAQPQLQPQASPVDPSTASSAQLPAPLGADAWRFEAGLEHLAARRYAEAIELFGTLAQTPPDNPVHKDALFNLGVARAGAGLDDAAVATFREYLTIAPDDPEGQLYLGNALLRLGRRPEAQAAYVAYLQRAGNAPEADQVRKLVDSLSAAATPPPAAEAATAGKSAAPGKTP